MSDEDNSDNTTARALLAHFNHELASKLVDKLLKHSPATTQKRVMEAVWNLLPQAIQDSRTAWLAVAQTVERAVMSHIVSDSFKARLASLVDRSVNNWLDEAIQNCVKDRASTEVRNFLKMHDGSALAKTIPGRLHIAIEQAIRDVATEAATAAKAKA